MKAYGAKRKLYIPSKRHPEICHCKNRMSFWGLQGWSHRYSKDKLNGKKHKKEAATELPF